MKISKFEIDQLKNAIENEYVKIPFFDKSILECKTLVKNSESNMANQLKVITLSLKKI